MRIGIMLRSIDERGGIGVYTRSIVEELLKIDQRNEYLLLYRTPQHLARYANFSNATSRLIPGRSKVIWDQILIPRMVHRERVDLLFHPKFTLPLRVNVKTVMTVHGADWYLPGFRRWYHPVDVWYIKMMMPMYFRRADAIISVSDYSTRSFVEHLPSCANKIQTIHLAPKAFFRVLPDQNLLQGIREKYRLPERYILTVTHYDTGRKNFANMAKGYRIARSRGIPHQYVVCGRDVEKYAQDPKLQGELGEDVIFKGWIEQEDLPAIYNAADLYLYPTRIEAFPIPISEALACGCPIVTTRGAPYREVAGDAAVFVDPESPEEIANGIVRVLGDPDLRESLRGKGIERAKNFSYRKCGEETLALFEAVMTGGFRPVTGTCL